MEMREKRAGGPALRVLAVSGFKNTGKTTLGVELAARLTALGLRVGVVKHDGHDFEPDVSGTDSYRYGKAGAVATAVFSADRYSLHRRQPDTRLAELLAMMTDMDVVLVEGLKREPLPRIEILRAGVSETPVCDAATRIAIVADFDVECPGCAVVRWGDWNRLMEVITRWMKEGNPHDGSSRQSD